MAVRLGDRGPRSRRQPGGGAESSGPARQQLGQRAGLLAAAARRPVAGQQLGRVGPEHRRAAGLEPDHRHAGRSTGRSAPTVRRSTRSAVAADRWRSRSGRSTAARAGTRPGARRPPAPSTAAWPIAGWKLLVKVSGHSTTAPRGRTAPGRSAARTSCERLRRRTAGSSRRRSTPPGRLISRASPGVWASALTSAGRGRRDQPRQQRAASPSSSATAGGAGRRSGGPGTRPCRWPCRR